MKESKLLGEHPEFLERLAFMLKLVDETKEWPQGWVHGYIALIPKNENEEDDGPLDQRPISVMSLTYRLRAATR